jgi:hypothetical protein
MKNILSLMLSVLIATVKTLAQTTVTIGAVTAAPGSAVSVPVTASSVSDMQGFQFTIVYDDTKLTYVDCSGWSGGTNSPAVQITSISGQPKLTFVYNDASVNIASGLFFNLNFQVLQVPNSVANITWSDSPTPRELSTSDPQVITATYNDGSVTIDNTIGINTLASETVFSVYPNPGAGLYTISSNAAAKFDLEVCNQLGEVMYTSKLNKKTTVLDIQDYSAGVYFITLNDGDKIVTGKVIKQ